MDEKIFLPPPYSRLDRNFHERTETFMKYFDLNRLCGGGSKISSSRFAPARNFTIKFPEPYGRFWKFYRKISLPVGKGYFPLSLGVAQGET